MSQQAPTGSTLGHQVKKWLWRLEAQLARPFSGGSDAKPPADYGVLIVCLGNYCRSPVAEGVLRAKLVELGLDGAVRVESAGTSSYYEGRRPHRYARREALRRGVDIGGHRAQAVDGLDLAAYDLVVAVDERTRDELSSVDPARLVLLGSFSEGGDIADPNGCEPRFFAKTHDAIEAACVNLARFLADRCRSVSELATQ